MILAHICNIPAVSNYWADANPDLAASEFALLKYHKDSRCLCRGMCSVMLNSTAALQHLIECCFR